MASPSPVESGNKRKRRRMLATATVAFILSTIILWFARLIPLPLPRAATIRPFTSIEAHPSNHKLPLSKQHQGGEDEEQATLTMAPTTVGHQPHRNKGKDAGLIRLATLPPAHLPTPAADSPRLIIIGDVHGQLAALKALLSKLEFSRARGDHVVFVGDLVNKGPDSSGVVDLAMSIGASAVRGNHEDRVLRAYEWEEERARRKDGRSSSEEEDEGGHHEEKEREETEEEEEAKRTKGKGKGKGKGKKRKGKGKEKFKEPKPNKEDRATAASLTPAQRAWLADLPVILRVGAIAPYGDVLVVHGGLVPGVPLEEQNLQAVMNMRSLVPRRKLKKTWRAQHEDGDDHLTSFLSKQDAANALGADYSGDDEEDDDDDDDDEGVDSNYDYDYDVTQTNTQHRLSTLALDPLPPPLAATRNRDRDRDRDRALVPSETHHGRPWAKAWDAAQRRAARRRADHSPPTANANVTTVIYGHDARTGLAEREYAVGLDSGCVRGGELTAAVFEAVPVPVPASVEGETGKGKGGKGKGKEEKGKGVVIERRLVGVACEEWDGRDGGKKEKGDKGKGKGENHKHEHKHKDKTGKKGKEGKEGKR
ncbi:Metallo-dependent phosphatase-like protein [Biscogniauxia marginata]|nr:Metallo-dependent phosphatase-like protein [Biscogniauxia marginata]